MPMKNARAFVRAAIESVLSERTVGLELVVVDDGSTDGSRSVVEAIEDDRIVLIDGPRRGVSASFNTGLAAASSQIIMCCDADDLYQSGRIKAQVDWLRYNPHFDAVCGRFSTMDSEGRFVADLVCAPSQGQEEEITGELAAGVVRTHFCTFATRRQVFESVGCQREYFETAQDTDLQLRMSEKCRIMFLPQNFYRYRLHGASITHQQANLRREFFESTAFSFHAQRKSGLADSLMAGKPPSPPDVSQSSAMAADDQVFGMIVGTAWIRFNEGRLVSAIATGAKLIGRYPFRFESWSSFCKLCVKSVLRRQTPQS